MKKLLAMLLALVMALSMLTVAAFAESNDDGDTIPIEDDETTDPVVDEPVVDENPKTGIVLSVIPMVMAGAAVAFSKKH